MNRTVLILVATLALTGCGSAPKCVTPDAQGIVGAMRPKEQFRSILEAVTERTQTAAIVSKRDGSSSSEARSRALEHEQNFICRDASRANRVISCARLDAENEGDSQ